MKDFIGSLRETEVFDIKSEWIKSLRKFSNERFLNQGFPTVKNEDWIYTRTFPIEQSKFIFDYSEKLMEEENTILFNNSSISIGKLEKGIEIKRVQDIEYDAEIINKIMENEKDLNFVNLNYAFFNQGLVINVKKNLKKKIKIVFNLEKNFCSFPFILINIEKNIKASILEKNFLYEDSLQNVVFKIFCDKNSSLEYYKIQKNEGFLIDNSSIFLEEKSFLKLFTICSGGRILRNNLNISLRGEKSNVDALGIYYGYSNQNIDNNISIEHLSPDCFSKQLYKGILEDNSKAAFTGKVLVSKNAQKTDASQLNKTLLLGDKAEMNTRPQLKIEANDVKCSHGATMVQPNEDEIFYLETRNIPRENAIELLRNAFIDEIIEKIPKELHEEIKKLYQNK